MKMTKTQQYIVVGVFGLLGLIFVYYQFVLKPVNDQITSLRSTLEQKKKDLDEAKKIIAKYAEFKKKADSIQRELEWVQNRIPKIAERGKIVEDVNFLQARSGLLLTAFKFSPAPVSKDIYTEISAEVKFTSSYKELLSFLYEMSISRSLMTVKDLKLTTYTDITNPLSGKTLSGSIILSGVQAK